MVQVATQYDDYQEISNLIMMERGMEFRILVKILTAKISECMGKYYI